VDRQPQNFHYLARNEMPAIFGDSSLLIAELSFWQ
jgi:hypothetical protein